MPRGRARGYELQRETILARAAELFARHGYTATTMNQVAEACGVSKPALYHYVRDKHQLLVEIAAGHIGRLLALVDEVGAAALAPEPRVRALIHAFMACTPTRRTSTACSRRTSASSTRPNGAASSAASARSSPPLPRPSLPLARAARHQPREAAGDAALRHDELDVHLAPAQGRAQPRRHGAGRGRPVLRRPGRHPRPGRLSFPFSVETPQRSHPMSFTRTTLVAFGSPRRPRSRIADINVGVTVSATGPGASLGIPEKNTSPSCRRRSAARR
jgi:AcrR family transcriptional regulator